MKEQPPSSSGHISEEKSTSTADSVYLNTVIFMAWSPGEVLPVHVVEQVDQEEDCQGDPFSPPRRELVSWQQHLRARADLELETCCFVSAR